jgi:mRNA interferase YafQ
MYEIKKTSRFERDFARIRKNDYDMSLLRAVITLLRDGGPLPEAYQDHPLKANWTGFRECHIDDDWLLVYRKNDKKRLITLAATGTHAELF